MGYHRDAIDRAYLLRERKRRADPDCEACGGDGNDPVDDDFPCFCIMRAGDFGTPDPLADEGQSDARELARDH